MLGGLKRAAEEEYGYTNRNFTGGFSHEIHLHLVYLSVAIRPGKPTLHVTARLHGLR